jgi:hypothetical protein
MPTFDLIPVTIRDARDPRAMARRPTRNVVIRTVASGLALLGLGVAIGLLSATYEINRQERASRQTR